MTRRRRSTYHNKPRHLYALVFDHAKAVYIGQSVDVARRASQHRSTGGGWLGRPFRVVPLETIQGTFDQAEVREYVWRWVAMLRGWTVYLKPPGMVLRRAYGVSYQERMRLGRLLPFSRRWETWKTLLTVGWPVRRIVEP